MILHVGGTATLEAHSGAGGTEKFFISILNFVSLQVRT